MIGIDKVIDPKTQHPSTDGRYKIKSQATIKQEGTRVKATPSCVNCLYCKLDLKIANVE
jgi:hypothetical protein